MKIHYLLLIVISIQAGGCASAIRDSGKSLNYNRSIKSKTIHRDLGVPEFVEQYHPAKSLHAIEQLESIFDENGKPHRFAKHVDPNRRVSRMEIHLFQGAMKYRGLNDDYGMMFGLTFGFSELMLIPDAIESKKQREKDRYRIYVWYDAKNRYIVHKLEYLGRADDESEIPCLPYPQADFDACVYIVLNTVE